MKLPFTIKAPNGVELEVEIKIKTSEDALESEEQKYEDECYEALSSIGDMEFI